ncbi:MAG: alkyl hydroperoxide reductase subunit F [Rubrivivax sp.]
MLDSTLKTQLQDYLERLKHPVAVVASLDERGASDEMREFLADITGLHPLVTVRLDGDDARRPSFTVGREHEEARVHFAAVPMGHEFTSLVLALLQTGGHPPRVEGDVVEQIRSLETEMVFETTISLSCHNCPDVVQALNLMAILNPRIKSVTIDGSLFQDEVEAREIMAVPSVWLNGKPFGSGRMELVEILAKVDTQASARAAARLATTDAFDVLIVGGGPAGAGAAVYAARKGIRTGIVAERFGGQTLDTMGIENYLSVQQTQGPSFAAAMEAQVRGYGVDIMNSQRVQRIEPAPEPGGLVTVTLDNGAALKSRSVILATGARWRTVDVPGEAKYRNKGVAYCPHCDGPLFKGKRVAVIGGGNSGIEAAIDLAGLVAHVTVLEFADALKADAVLVAKLNSLPNVDVHTAAQTLEITGNGSTVDGLLYKSRASGETHRVELAGVFVQIGLVPNTEFLKGTLELSRHGEIVIDSHCATSLPGVFAAGDVTTVPYKQIVIAGGEGSKAALSAFDYLIRSPLPDSRANAPVEAELQAA